MQRRTLALGGIVLAGAALLLFCCTGHGERTASAPPAASGSAPATTGTPSAPPGATSDTSTPAAAAKATPSAAAGTSLQPTPSGSGTAAVGTPPPQAGPGGLIARTVQASDPRDLELLANIERDLKRDPPPEVHALIAARKRGANRDELTLAIRALPDLGVRVLAFRWLDAVTPAADAGAH